eukprot:11495139-Ditylum_brightwellii.AAC.1
MACSSTWAASCSSPHRVRHCNSNTSHQLLLYSTCVPKYQVLLFEKSDMESFFGREDLYLDSMMFDNDTMPT